MTPINHHARFVFYLALSAAGLVTAWKLTGIATVTDQDYLSAWFGSAVDWVLSVDLLIVAVAGSAFMIFEARKLGMKRVWLYIALSGVTAFAFTFPLFLALRERRIARLATSAT